MKKHVLGIVPYRRERLRLFCNAINFNIMHVRNACSDDEHNGESDLSGANVNEYSSDSDDEKVLYTPLRYDACYDGMKLRSLIYVYLGSWKNVSYDADSVSCSRLVLAKLRHPCTWTLCSAPHATRRSPHLWSPHLRRPRMRRTCSHHVPRCLPE